MVCPQLFIPPVRSPESNGMAEAFVKTFKRDYVYVHDRPDAKTVMSQLDQWFEDYNEYHPHKGLKMKSPRQFIRSQLLTASFRFNGGNSKYFYQCFPRNASGFFACSADASPARSYTIYG